MAKNFNTAAYSKYPLGIRNNNPGNLRTGESWQGATGANSGFVVFSDLSYGIRAAATVLVNNITDQGNNTIRKLISKYAPPSENNTDAYISAVSNSTGIAPDEKIGTDTQTLVKMLHAIFIHENGAAQASLITDADILEGINKMSALWLQKLTSFFVDNPTATAVGGIGLLIALAVIIYITFFEPKIFDKWHLPIHR